MFRLTKPSEYELRNFWKNQADLPFSYTAVGATASGRAPRGFVVDRYRVCLGSGEEIWHCAKAAIDGWQMFALGWFGAWRPEVQIQRNLNVVVFGTHYGFWSVNACRVVYVIEDAQDRCHGFAYGTLLDHAESGEERFTVRRYPEDGSVWYEVLAFSRPNQTLSRACYPFARRLQKKFARDSSYAMQKAVNSPRGARN